MLIKKHSIFFMLFLGNCFLISSLDAMKTFSTYSRKYHKSFKKYKPDTRYYKKYKQVKINNNKHNYFVDFLLFGLGVIAFEDIYSNHLENIVNVSVLDFLETETGKVLVDEWASKITKSMISSFNVSNIIDVESLFKAVLRKSLKKGLITINTTTGKPLINNVLLLVPNKKVNQTIDDVLDANILKENSKIIMDPVRKMTEDQLKVLINSNEFYEMSKELMRSLVLYSFSPSSIDMPQETIEIFGEEIRVLKELEAKYSYVAAVKAMPFVMSPYISSLTYFNPSRAIAISTAGTMIPLSLMLNYFDKESVMKGIKNTIDFVDEFKINYPYAYNYIGSFLDHYEEESLRENFLTQEESMINILKECTVDELNQIGKNVEKKIEDKTADMVNLIVTFNNIRPLGGSKSLENIVKSN